METRTQRHVLKEHLDRASSVVIVLTFALFVASLLAKGLTHDLFLETGVLLVSVKLIINTYHLEIHSSRLEERIDDLLSITRTLAHEPPEQLG